MRSLRYALVVGLAALVPLAALAATENVLTSGSYSLSPVTKWAKFKNMATTSPWISTLPDKPQDLQVELTDPEKAVATYGFVVLGNMEQKIFMAMGRIETSKTDFLYIDLDNDGKLVVAERIEIKRDNPFKEGDLELQWAEPSTPVECQVKYRKADGTVVTCPISVRFRSLRLRSTKTSAEKNLYRCGVNTWFTGTGRFEVGKETKELQFALIDNNDNGNFNEYGLDLMLVDLNDDGMFDLEKERLPFVELDEVSIDSKTVNQRRKALFAWPTTLVVQPAKAGVDWSALEPK